MASREHTVGKGMRSRTSAAYTCKYEVRVPAMYYPYELMCGMDEMERSETGETGTSGINEVGCAVIRLTQCPGE